VKFSLIKVDNSKKLKALSRNKVNFLKKEEDASLFHFNKFDNDLFHAVFNVNDEYQIGTKKLGKQYNYAYSSLINFFFLLSNNYALIEHLNEKYKNEVLDYINNKTDAKLKAAYIDNSIIINLYRSLSGTVKKIEYTNNDDELFDKDFVSDGEFYEIANAYTIDRLTLLVDKQFLSITKKGKITIDNSDEGFLIKFTKRILDAIEQGF